MAQLTEIVISRSVKINLGDYESQDIFTSMKADVSPGEDEGEARAELTRRVERAMVVQIMAHLKARGRNVDKDYVIKRYGFGGVK